MTGVTLDWSSAEVRDGKLEVSLRGELPSGWKHSFDRTVALLPGGDWDKVSLKKELVRVQGVTQGDEDRLRHFLESVVMQANADHPQQDPEAHEPRDEGAGQDKDEDDSPDLEMTERFRSFGSEPPTDAKSG